MWMSNAGLMMAIWNFVANFVLIIMGKYFPDEWRDESRFDEGGHPLVRWAWENWLEWDEGLRPDDYSYRRNAIIEGLETENRRSRPRSRWLRRYETQLENTPQLTKQWRIRMAIGRYLGFIFVIFFCVFPLLTSTLKLIDYFLIDLPLLNYIEWIFIFNFGLATIGDLCLTIYWLIANISSTAGAIK